MAKLLTLKQQIHLATLVEVRGKNYNESKFTEQYHLNKFFISQRIANARFTDLTQQDFYKLIGQRVTRIIKMMEDRNGNNNP